MALDAAAAGAGSRPTKERTTPVEVRTRHQGACNRPVHWTAFLVDRDACVSTVAVVPSSTWSPSSSFHGGHVQVLRHHVRGVYVRSGSGSDSGRISRPGTSSRISGRLRRHRHLANSGDPSKAQTHVMPKHRTGAARASLTAKLKPQARHGPPKPWSLGFRAPRVGGASWACGARHRAFRVGSASGLGGDG